MPDPTMKDIFYQCQESIQSHGKLLKLLHKIYQQMPLDEFWSAFSNLLKYSMIVFKREPAVERTINFITQFTILVSSKITTEKTDESLVTGDNLLKRVFKFILLSHDAKDRAVRFRCCQLMHKLLTDLSEEAFIEDDLYQQVSNCMLQRLYDRVTVVRVHAALCLCRLQNPADENCPIIKAYLFFLSSDPHADVRRCILNCIAPSEMTLPAILERIRDINESVRKAAYQLLADKVHVKVLSIAQRIQILSSGLNDRSVAVMEVCSKGLVQAWLRIFDGNVIDLLTSLDVEFSRDTCKQLLDILFQHSSVSQLVTNFGLLNEQITIPIEKLSCENAMYWCSLCEFIHGIGVDGEEYIDKILPCSAVFCDYINSFMEMLGDMSQSPEKILALEFIFQQLIMMTKFLDTADQATCKNLVSLFRTLLLSPSTGHRIVGCVVSQLAAIKSDADSAILFVAEVVSEIREPIIEVEHSVDSEEKRLIVMKIAALRVKVHELRIELEECVKCQEFARAAELKAKLAELEEQKSKCGELAQSYVEEVRTEKNDPNTLLKCLSIVHELLKLPKICVKGPVIQALMESLILPCIQNENPSLRNVAMKCLSLRCLANKDMAFQYVALFIHASYIDVGVIQVTALKAIFDILLIFGMELFKNDSKLPSAEGDKMVDQWFEKELNENEEPISAEGETNNPTSKLVGLLCQKLESEDSEICSTVAEGLSKLLLARRVVSPKILSHLIILWFNPLTEDDNYLRHCLGVFFQVFASKSRSNQQVYADAFLPTLQTLFNAPASSPLSKICASSVAELMVELTSSKLLMLKQPSSFVNEDDNIHEEIAIEVCNDIISKPSSFSVQTLAKILTQLSLTKGSSVSLKHLSVLAEQMMQVVKDKKSLKYVEKFQNTLDKALTSGNSNEPVQTNQEALVDNKSSTTPTEDTATMNNQPPAPVSINEKCYRSRIKSYTPNTSHIPLTPMGSCTRIMSKSTGKRAAKKQLDIDLDAGSFSKQIQLHWSASKKRLHQESQGEMQDSFQSLV